MLFLKSQLTGAAANPYHDGHHETRQIYNEWNLLPESSSAVLPDYIPQAIQTDYYEACSIKTLSPKASATLSRRCIQGMIRDYWDIQKATLHLEIKELKEKVDSNTWESIDVVRNVGNIGAHMEKDINIIIDVEPEEAQLLISLIEQLVQDWYVHRYSKQERAENLKKLAAQKEGDKQKTN
jgi:predicted transport protein